MQARSHSRRSGERISNAAVLIRCPAWNESLGHMSGKAVPVAIAFHAEGKMRAYEYESCCPFGFALTSRDGAIEQVTTMDVSCKYKLWASTAKK